MNKPSHPTRKYEIRERYFHLEPVLTKPSLIELPGNETIIGTHISPGINEPTKLCIITAKDVTHAD